MRHKKGTKTGQKSVDCGCKISYHVSVHNNKDIFVPALLGGFAFAGSQSRAHPSLDVVDSAKSPFFW